MNEMSKLIDITGKALSGEWGTDDELGTGIPVLRTTNFTNDGVVNYKDVVTRTITKKNIDDKFLRNGDIIIEKSGGSDKQPVGRVIYFEGPENTYLFNNFTGLLRVKKIDKWFPKYVFYALFSNYQKGGTRRFENKTTGLHNLKTDIYISSFEIKDIDILTQEKICKQLDSVRNIIQLRKQQLQQLDELVKARFVELFGDIKINNFNVKTAPMTDICEIIDGDRGKNYPKQDEFFEEGFCLFLNAKNVTSNGFDFSNCMYISKEKDEILRKGKLTRGDVILTTRGTIGNLAYYSDDIPFENIRINSGMVILRMNHKIVDEIFFIEQFKLQLEDIKRKIASGSAQPQLPISTMNKINMIVPPINEQKYFSEFVKQVDKSKFVVQKALDEAQTLFDSLMQEYFG